jgi:hypothetical protein
MPGSGPSEQSREGEPDAQHQSAATCEIVNRQIGTPERGRNRVEHRTIGMNPGQQDCPTVTVAVQQVTGSVNAGASSSNNDSESSPIRGILISTVCPDDASLDYLSQVRIGCPASHLYRDPAVACDAGSTCLS